MNWFLPGTCQSECFHHIYYGLCLGFASNPIFRPHVFLPRRILAWTDWGPFRDKTVRKCSPGNCDYIDSPLHPSPGTSSFYRAGHEYSKESIELVDHGLSVWLPPGNLFLKDASDRGNSPNFASSFAQLKGRMAGFLPYPYDFNSWMINQWN